LRHGADIEARQVLRHRNDFHHSERCGILRHIFAGKQRIVKQQQRGKFQIIPAIRHGDFSFRIAYFYRDSVQIFSIFKLTDTHSPGPYRTIGAPVNMDAWYNAFDVKPGNKLYKKPEDRILIW
jgi:hypothetical protein